MRLFIFFLFFIFRIIFTAIDSGIVSTIGFVICDENYLCFVNE